MRTHFDVVIHGGGLAGNSLAVALAPTGLQIGVIEPFPPSDTHRSLLESRTIALSHGARRIYEGMQIWPKLAPYCTPIERIHISDKGHFGMTRIHAKEQKMPALGYVMQIAAVNRILCEQLQTYENVYYLSPAVIDEAKLAEEKWHLNLKSLLTQPRPLENWTCNLLIAADGGQSPLRQMAGLSAQEKEYGQTAIVTSIQLASSHKNTAYERFIDEGAIALLPVADNIAAVILTIADAELATWKSLSDSAFLRQLQVAFGYRLGRFSGLGSRVYYPLKLVTTEEQIATQFVLMGNAAHILHPIAAQSFNLSLRDIAVLAEHLATAVKKGQHIHRASLLEEYAQHRKQDQHRTVQFTDRLIHVFSNSFLTLPRNLAMVGLDMAPPLKMALGKYGAGTWGRLSRLARGLTI